MGVRVLYAIDYKNMRTGVYGLLVYKEREKAEKVREALDELERVIDRFDRGELKGKTSEDLQDYYNKILENIFSKVDIHKEEINPKDIDMHIKYNRHSKQYKHRVDNKIVRIINTTYYLYL